MSSALTAAEQRIQALELLLASVVDAYVPSDRKELYSQHLTSTIQLSVLSQKIALYYLLDRLTFFQADSSVQSQRAQELLLEIKHLRLEALSSSGRFCSTDQDLLQNELLLKQQIDGKFAELAVQNSALVMQLRRNEKQVQTERAVARADVQQCDPVICKTTPVPVSASYAHAEGQQEGLHLAPRLEWAAQRRDALSKHRILMLEQKVQMQDGLISRLRQEIAGARRQRLQ